MKLSRLDRLILDCEQHLDSTSMRGTQIENYFVQYLLVRIVAEYEIRIEQLIERRCTRMRDKHVKQFSRHSVKDACRRGFKMQFIKEVLGKFGDDYKKLFSDRIPATNKAHVAWHNIYTNRIAVAHGAGAQMSFRDLKIDYSDSLVILDEVVAALALKSREIRDLK